MSSRRPWSPADVVEPLGPVTGPARLLVETAFGDEDWDRWRWARPKQVYAGAGAARRRVDGPVARVQLWFLERGGLGRRSDAALRVQYGIVPADARKP